MSPLALWVGGHALAAYALGLLAVMAGAALAWRLLHRWMVPRQDSALPPVAFLLSRVALGFAIIVTGGWAFGEIAEHLGTQPGVMAKADVLLAETLRSNLPHTVMQVFAAVTHLADPLVLVLAGIAVAVVLWRVRRSGLAVAWSITLLGNAVLNPTLKQVFARSRPEHAHSLVQAQGYSFPSGHSSGAVVAYGMLAYVLVRTLPPRWHLPLAVAAAAVAYTVGCSRVFLGVHFASDVLAGFATGSAWLAVCVTSVELARHYRRRRPASDPGAGA